MSNHTYVPFRRFYSSGKRRPITNPEHDAFMKAIDTIMAEYGVLDDHGNGGWNVQTDYGVLRVHRGLDWFHTGYCYDINTAFEAKANYAALGERFGTGRDSSRSINPFSGKWNMLAFEGDDCIDELKERLALVGAKKLTVPA